MQDGIAIFRIPAAKKILLRADQKAARAGPLVFSSLTRYVFRPADLRRMLLASPARTAPSQL